jgi:hypothetical protein
VVSSIVRLLRVVSLLVCVILITSFVFFAVDRTKSALARQRESLSPTLASASAAPSLLAPAPQRSPVRRMIDDASPALTSPFSAIVAPSDGAWAVRSAELLIALALYGFGVCYLARVVRIRL